MNEIVVLTAGDLRELMAEAVREGVTRALRSHEPQIPTYVNDEKAAEYIGVSPATLRAWRVEKRGPKYHKFERTVRYSRADLDAWVKSRGIHTIDSLENRRGTSCL